MKNKLTLFSFLILTLIFTACAPAEEYPASNSPAPASVTQTHPPLSQRTPLPAQEKIEFISSNEIQALTATIDLTSVTSLDIHLPATPVWIAGTPHPEGTVWAVAYADGSLQAFIVKQNGYVQTTISPAQQPAGMPLTIYTSASQISALTAPADADTSPLTTPVLTNSNSIAYISASGELVIWKDDRETRLPVNALPDTRIQTDSNGRLLLLSNPTERYRHDVLGDSIEASAVTLIETRPTPRITKVISVPKSDVIEGIAPLWVDLNNNGQREIIVTLSNAQSGARIAAYHEDGTLLAEGPAIGTGNRWRHQLIAAPFGENGETLLAVVRTPHIGGVVEFYRLNGDKLEIVETINGISTHSIGSRNLFTAQAGDFNNDGQVDLLAPDQSHTRLGIVSMGGEKIAWLDLGAALVSNLAAVSFPETDQVVIAAGLSNNTLRIWNP
ncbi:MAG: hypothetical protein Kow002_20170 [Anaerolineales bacterium]